MEPPPPVAYEGITTDKTLVGRGTISWTWTITRVSSRPKRKGLEKENVIRFKDPRYWESQRNELLWQWS